MKTTNEMIADLVATGFELPEGLHDAGDRGPKLPRWYMVNGQDAVAILDQQALDLIACAFARGMARRIDWHHALLVRHQEAMMLGQSEDAIKALWEAVCDA